MKPIGGEWASSAEEAKAHATKLAGEHAQLAGVVQFLSQRMAVAAKVRHGANAELDDTVGAAYKSAALAAHPDKRRSSSSADTLAFQRLRTAYDTLRDAELRRLYIDTLDHDAFIAQRAAAAAAEAAAAERERGERSSAPAGKALRIGAGVPNRCTCPTVRVLGGDADAAALLQWACHRAAEFDVQGYELQGSRLQYTAPPTRGPWEQLAEPGTQLGCSVTVAGLQPGEWVFRVRACAYSGAGDWSMASEGVLLGGDAAGGDPAAAERRKAEAAQRAAARKAEAQEAARDNLSRWAAPAARRAADVLEQLSRAVAAARRAGLPARAADAALLQRCEDGLAELRDAAVNRAAMAEWRPTLRDLTKRAPAEPEAAAALATLLAGLGAGDEAVHPGVADTAHQLLKRCACDAREKHAHDAAAVERVVELLQGAAARSDVWASHKLAELAQAAEELQAAHSALQLQRQRAAAAAARKAARERAAADAARAQAEARQAAEAAAAAERAKVAQARRDAAAAAQRAAFQSAVQPRPAVPAVAPAPYAEQQLAQPHPALQGGLPVGEHEEFDCPVCLEHFCSGERKEPVAFPCGHMVCMACLEQLKAAHPKCPSCREVRRAARHRSRGRCHVHADAPSAASPSTPRSASACTWPCATRRRARSRAPRLAPPSRRPSRRNGPLRGRNRSHRRKRRRKRSRSSSRSELPLLRRCLRRCRSPCRCRWSRPRPRPRTRMRRSSRTRRHRIMRRCSTMRSRSTRHSSSTRSSRSTAAMRSRRHTRSRTRRRRSRSTRRRSPRSWVALQRASRSRCRSSRRRCTRRTRRRVCQRSRMRSTRPHPSRPFRSSSRSCSRRDAAKLCRALAARVAGGTVGHDCHARRAKRPSGTCAPHVTQRRTTETCARMHT